MLLKVVFSFQSSSPFAPKLPDFSCAGSCAGLRRSCLNLLTNFVPCQEVAFHVFHAALAPDRTCQYPIIQEAARPLPPNTPRCGELFELAACDAGIRAQQGRELI